jgi:cation diffusion facilitator family transporter
LASDPPAVAPGAKGKSPRFYAGLSVATALATLALKGGAAWITGSVGLLSDALEGLVNLFAAILAFIVLSYAHDAPDREHNFGHEKAEYFSSGTEGALIFVAAAAIGWTAIPRLVSPQPLEQLGIGLVIAAVAAALNGACAWAMLRAAREHRSITLEADARHLLTDVWTTGGVIVGVLLAGFTGWVRLDALVAIAVAVHILWTGASLMRRSFHGLMDQAVPEDERKQIAEILAVLRTRGCDYHELRTRRAGARSVVDVHILVPGSMSVQEGHNLVEGLEKEVQLRLPHVEMLTHLEPIEDPRSWTDETHRTAESPAPSPSSSLPSSPPPETPP